MREPAVATTSRAREGPGWADVVLILGAALGMVATWWPVVLASVLWVGSETFRRSGAAPAWFRRAALLLTLAALALGTETWKLWAYGGASGGHPLPTTHDGFHKVLELGMGMSGVLAWLVLAWGPLAQGSRWGLAGLAATLPGAVLFVWAGMVGLAQDAEWAHMHVLVEGYVVAVPIFVLLAAVCAARGRTGVKDQRTFHEA